MVAPLILTASARDLLLVANHSQSVMPTIPSGSVRVAVTGFPCPGLLRRQGQRTHLIDVPHRNPDGFLAHSPRFVGDPQGDLVHVVPVGVLRVLEVGRADEVEPAAVSMGAVLEEGPVRSGDWRGPGQEVECVLIRATVEVGGGGVNRNGATDVCRVAETHIVVLVGCCPPRRPPTPPCPDPTRSGSR